MYAGGKLRKINTGDSCATCSLKRIDIGNLIHLFSSGWIKKKMLKKRELFCNYSMKKKKSPKDNY